MRRRCLSALLRVPPRPPAPFSTTTATPMAAPGGGLAGRAGGRAGPPPRGVPARPAATTAPSFAASAAAPGVPQPPPPTAAAARRVPPVAPLPTPAPPPTTTPPATVTGTVVRVTYTAPDSDYRVLRVRADAPPPGAPRTAPAGGALVTVVGALPGVGEGATGTFDGAWGEHPRFGKQLAATRVSLTPPTSAAAAAALLAGARLPGVGPAIAARIVAALGPDTLAVLDGSGAAAALARVKGLSKAKAAAIKAAWDADRGTRAAAGELAGLPLPPRLARALLRAHGPAAAELVKSDPHGACATLDGASWRAVDALAGAVGAPPGSLSRGGAALAAVARRAAGAGGHTCVEWSTAERDARRLMASSGAPWPEDGPSLAAAAAAAVAAGRLVVEPPPPPVGGGGAGSTALAPPPPTPPSAPLSPVEAASLKEYLTRRIPGVGAATAAKLVASFGRGTVALLESPAAERSLTAAPGVGPASARRWKAGWDANPHRLPPWRGSVGGGSAAVAAAAAPPTLTTSWPPPTALVYAPDLHAAEATLAAALAARATPDAGARARADAARAWLIKNTPPGLTLSPGQADAVAAAAACRVLVLTGGPGTGKTAVTAAILAHWRAHGIRAALAAPTGRAALRLAECAGAPAVTLHRLLDCRGGGGGDGGDEGGDGGGDGASSSGGDVFGRGPSSPLPFDAVLIDEASLLDAPLAAALAAALPPTASLVLVGDANQLPPVGPGAVLADAAATPTLPRVHLTTVFRQAARSAVVAAAHAAHAGAPLPLERVPDGVLGDGESESSAWRPTIDALRVVPCPRRAAAAGLPLGYAELRALLTRVLPAAGFDAAADVQVLTPTRRGAGGTARLNAFLAPLLNPGAGHSVHDAAAASATTTTTPPPLRPGDRVMQTVNNYDLDVFNGDVGTVTAASPPSTPPAARSATVVFGGGRARTLTGAALADVEPAWAATVHKAQGGEAPAVVLFLDGSPPSRRAASRRLLYTALTRAKGLAVVVAPDDALAALAGAAGGDAPRRTSLRARLKAAADLGRVAGNGDGPPAAAAA